MSVLRNAANALSRIAGSRPANFLLLAAAYVLVASASFNGYYQKWALNDGKPRYSIEAMLDGSASRPFVYRQLLPDVANFIDEHIPDKVDYALERAIFKDGELRTKIEAPLASDSDYIWRYHAVYYAAFFSLLVACFALRRLFLSAGFSPFGSAVAPAFVVGFLPIFQTGGGFFYDLPEVMFMALAAAIAWRGHWLLLIPLSVLATWNKEAFLFFIITLYPLLRVRLSRVTAGLAVVLSLGTSGATYLLIRQRFSDNPGGAAEWHLFDALKFYTNPIELLKVEVNYGVLGPKSYGVVALGLIGLIVLKGFSGLPTPLRQHLALALMVNLPLFIMLCYPGEMRNLSMLYLSLGALIASAIDANGRSLASQAN